MLSLCCPLLDGWLSVIFKKLGKEKMKKKRMKTKGTCNKEEEYEHRKQVRSGGETKERKRVDFYYSMNNLTNITLLWSSWSLSTSISPIATSSAVKNTSRSSIQLVRPLTSSYRDKQKQRWVMNSGKVSTCISNTAEHTHFWTLGSVSEL